MSAHMTLDQANDQALAGAAGPPPSGALSGPAAGIGHAIPGARPPALQGPAPPVAESAPQPQAQIQPQTQAGGQIAADPDQLQAGFSGSMRNVVRFLEAVAQSSPGVAPDAFRGAWAAVASPTSTTAMHSSMQHLFTMPAPHVAAVLGGLDDQTRAYFHVQIMQLAQEVRKDMPELSQAAALMRWLLSEAMPALQGQPEDSELGTTNELRKNYAVLDTLCQIARPDSSNPKINQMGQQMQGLHAAHAALKAQHTALAERATAAGLDPADAATDESNIKTLTCKGAKGFKIATIVLGCVLAIALIILIVFLVKKNGKGTGGNVPALGGRAPALPSTRARDPSFSSRDVGAAVLGRGDDWGFPSLGPV